LLASACASSDQGGSIPTSSPSGPTDARTVSLADSDLAEAEPSSLEQTKRAADGADISDPPSGPSNLSYMSTDGAVSGLLSSKRVVRPDTPEHTSGVRQILVAPDGQFAVTVSTDRTLKMWSLPGLQLIRTVRPPYLGADQAAEGLSNFGKLYAAAISPDGKLIAATGHLVDQETISIYVFRTEDGSLYRKLSRQGTTVSNALAFLPFSDVGSTSIYRLVAGRHLNDGLDVWNVSDGAFERNLNICRHPDPTRKSHVQDIEISRFGAIAIACSDSAVIELGPDLEIVASLDAASGVPLRGSPSDLAYSPDGASILVGYHKMYQPEIFLSPTAAGTTRFAAPQRRLPNIELADFESLSSVAWSNGGDFIYAGGSLGIEKSAVRMVRWNLRDPADIQVSEPIASGSIQSIAGWGQDSVLYAARTGEIGGLDSRLQVGATRARVINDFRIFSSSFEQTRVGHGNDADAFLVSDDASQLIIRDERSDQDGGYLYFDVQMGELRYYALADAPSGPTGLAERLFRSGASDRKTGYGMPIHEIGTVRLTEWLNSRTPRIDGHPVTFDSGGERSRAATLFTSPEGSIRAAIASGYRLKVLDQKAREIWNTGLPGSGSRVVVTRDGKTLLGAFDDGTIRWISTDSGEVLLSAFFHKDGRWTTWTPDGAYNAALGGEELAGWHVETPAEALALWYPASVYRDAFHDPFIAVRALGLCPATGCGAEIGAAEASPPGAATTLMPVPTIIGLPQSDGSSMRLSLRAKSLTGERIETVNIVADGQRVLLEDVAVETRGQGDEIEWDLVLPTASTYSFAPETQTGTGPGAEFKGLSRKPSAPAQSRKKRLIALLVGADEYAVPSLRLNYSGKDALDLERFLLRQRSDDMYHEVVIEVLVGADATKGNIEEKLSWLTRTCAGEVSSLTGAVCDDKTFETTRLLYLSGHGINLDGGFYFVPTDGGDFPGERSIATWVSDTELKAFVEESSGRRLLFLDTCSSGQTQAVSTVNELADKRFGAFVIASSGGDQVSREDSKLRNSIFTQALIEALGDQYEVISDYDSLAASLQRPTDRIDIESLAFQLKRRTEELSDTDPYQFGEEQSPKFIPMDIAGFQNAIVFKPAPDEAVEVEP
jgi:WD40 repeat protein